MKLDRRILELYAVTDRCWLNGKSLADDIREAILGGVTMVQLREKDLSHEEFLKEALEIKMLCNEFKVPFIINDNLEIMLEVDADGIHVGQSDMDAAIIRSKIGKDKILGVSCQTIEEALRAEASGADYLGVGAIFSTTTKSDAFKVSKETLMAICNATRIPIVAIGGIDLYNIKELKNTMIDGVAVVSAIFNASNIRKAADSLLSEVQKILFHQENYDLFIVDYDGTIIDSMPMWHDISSRFVAHFGKIPKVDLDQRVRTLSTIEAAQLIKEEYEFPQSVDSILDMLNQYILKVYPTISIKEGAIGFLKNLKKLNKKIVLLSASSLVLLDKSLDALNIKNFFDNIYSTSDLNLSKARGNAFEYVIEKEKVTKDKVIVIEDAIHAIKGAKKIGINVLAVSDTSNQNDLDEITKYSDYYYNIRRLER